MQHKQRNIGVLVGLLALAAALFIGNPTMAATCRLGPPSAGGYGAPTFPGCPTDIYPLHERLHGCDHWTGEEPYDEARGKEIEAAMKELGCDTVGADRDALFEKYIDRPDVISTIEAAAAMAEATGEGD